MRMLREVISKHSFVNVEMKTFIICWLMCMPATYMFSRYVMEIHYGTLWGSMVINNMVAIIPMMLLLM